MKVLDWTPEPGPGRNLSRSEVRGGLDAVAMATGQLFLKEPRPWARLGLALLDEG